MKLVIVKNQKIHYEIPDFFLVLLLLIISFLRKMPIAFRPSLKRPKTSNAMTAILLFGGMPKMAKYEFRWTGKTTLLDPLSPL